MVIVMEAKRGKEKELTDLLTSLLEPSRKEKGCLFYKLHTDMDYPRRVVFYEGWESKEAHSLHDRTEHVKKFLARKDELVQSLIVYNLEEAPIDLEPGSLRNPTLWNTLSLERGCSDPE